jgi:beta-galactosidase
MLILNSFIKLWLIIYVFIVSARTIDTNAQDSGKKDIKSIPDKTLNKIPFTKADLMKIGVFYYPEQWSENQWERDFNNIAKLGFEFTHLAEFSWTYIEPEEGRFDFKWLDKAVDMANKAGLKIIMCTPTLCPPAWMGDKYPGIYLVGSDGRRREHGIRANASLSNSVYRDFTERL